MSYVLVKSGEYRNRTVENTVFPVIKNFQFGANGGYITVDGSSVFGAEFSKVRNIFKCFSFSAFFRLPRLAGS